MIYFTVTGLEGGAGGLGGGYGSEFGSGILGKLDANVPKDLVQYGICLISILFLKIVIFF